MKKFIQILFAFTLILCFLTSSLFAMGGKMKKDKKAIVIASFGTTYPSGLKSIINIINHVKREFPETKVKVTFTSNIIRKIWEKRQSEAKKWLSQGIPEEVLYVKGIVATLGELADRGYKTIIIQPTHIYHGEEFSDVLEYARALNSIQTIKKKWKPFTKIVVGRPALGTYGPVHDYHEDITKGVKALKSDVDLARKKGAVLVYMGHGNEFFSTGIYAETQKEFRKQYPDVQTFIGTVEGYPSLADVVSALKSHAKYRKVVLKPFMIVAGDHANNDMAGDDSDSWKNVIKKAGFKVYPVLEGLGSNNKFAEIFVEHIKDVAKDNGIELK